jgi:hypothetical protein
VDLERGCAVSALLAGLVLRPFVIAVILLLLLLLLL